MIKLDLLKKRKKTFIDFFLKKEQKFLYKENPIAYNDKEFKSYIIWFVYAINDYMKEEYNINRCFTYLYALNESLNILFYDYIMSEEFKKRVMNDIIEYKQKYHKENIYE